MLLSSAEIEDAWVSLSVLWDANQDYWFPLRNDEPNRSDIVAFYTPCFESNIGDEWCRQVLTTKGIETVIELREGGEGRQVRVCDLEIYYSGLEGFWTSAGYDWLIYASHESSITLAGTLFTAELDRQLTDWRRWIYRGPFSEDYLS